MSNIEKRRIINCNNLSSKSYFISILHEAYSCGLLNDSTNEKIQLQCINLLASKCEAYSGGKSSSVRVEAAESIMKSILYTIGLYLKSLPDADCAASELKTAMIPEMYQRGRRLIGAKLGAARHVYKLVKRNKLTTLNYTYNATLHEGIESFFKAYNPDYEADECPGSIDYQLCCPVTGLTGVEFIQKYLENLYYENEFCRNFDSRDIHHLLCGYDRGYKDLLINIFEQVLTAALGCSLAGRRVVKLDLSKEEIQRLYNELSKDDEHVLASTVLRAAGIVLEELSITSLSLRKYIGKILPEITANISRSIKTNTLDKAFVSPVNPDLKPKIKFLSGLKMDDEEYRKLIEELLICRNSSDKLALIKEKVKSFGDFEDLLFDAELSEAEMASIISILGDVGIAALIKRHPFKTDIQAEVLTEAELALRFCLKSYIQQLEAGRQEKIFGLVKHLYDD